MVSPEKNKNAECEKLSKNKNSRTKKRKLSSVLKAKKFYLYFKNLTLLSKWEAQLRDFGALTVPYIDQQVHYVITDLPGYNGKSTSLAETSSIISPQCYSISPATPISGDDPSAAKKTRTRTEAMLEKVSVRTQGVSSISNPISTAFSWKIPVYSIDYFQTVLTKRLKQIQLINEAEDAKNDNKVHVFRKPFIKLEHVVDLKYRPEFKEIDSWPSISVNTELGSSPFVDKVKERKHAKHVPARKRMNRTKRTENRSGYCEICAVHYDDLSQHVASSTHVKFVCNDKHFAELDNCIKTRSVEALIASHNLNDKNPRMKELSPEEDMGRNLRKPVSLHLNNNNNNTNNENSAVTRSLTNAKLLADESLKQPLQVQCNGFTNYHLRKSTIKSDSVLLRSSGVMYGNHGGANSKDLLRETRKMYQSCPDTNQASPKDLAQLSPLDEGDGLHRLRSRKNLLLPAILIGTTAEDANKNRNQLSPLTPTSNHFLRSSSSPKLCLTTGRAAKGTTTATPAVDVADGVKKSTATLNAKHPLNPLSLHYTRSAHKMNCASPSPRDDTRVNGKPACRRKFSLTATSDDETSRTNVPSYQCNRSHDSPDDANEQNGNGRKRMSVEEKFLEDNKEYYKVEVLPSKLRSTEFYCTREADQATKKEEGGRRQQLLAAVDCDGKRLPNHKRQSALRLLNLEATNFLFGPPKQDDSSDESDESEEEEEEEDEEEEPSGSVTASTIADESAVNEAGASKANKHGVSTPGTAVANRRGRVKERKRRTHAEVFIHDNLDYYKFEISGSRLRHQSSESENSAQRISPTTRTAATCPPAIPSDIVKVKQEADATSTPVLIRRRGRGRKKLELPIRPPPPPPPPDDDDDDDETPPPPIKTEECDTQLQIKEEPADEVDFGERFIPPSDSPRFAFESVPSHEAWYQAFQRFDLCKEEYIPLPNTHYFTQYRDVVPFPRPRRDTERRGAATLPNSPLPRDNGAVAHFRRKRKSRLSRIIIDDKPRKSPRCHASTLAILSSLTGNRRRSRKLLASLEMSKARKPVGRPPLNRSVDLEANKALLAQVSQEYQKKLKEAVHLVAKDMDQHFIDVFREDDCEDAYLKQLKEEGELKTLDDNVEDWCCRVHIDDDLLQDKELLQALMNQQSDVFDDMSAFLTSSQSCTSMEAAQDEELMMPRSNDMLARLWRENDLSCNSSDCGASSTCEFLGFAEDGRTVSRKRKRKRPNMTGWPHDRNKRRQLRMSRVRANGVGGGRGKTSEANGRAGGDARADADSRNASETVSEAESECTDDDMPLNEFPQRKRRRTNNSLAAASDALEMKKNDPEAVNRERGSPSSSRRASKAAGSSLHSSPRRGTPITRRKSSAASAARRAR